MKVPIFDIGFWNGRLAEAPSIGGLQNAIGRGFNFVKIDEVHKKIVEELIKKEDKILDIGCGYGRTADWFTDEQYTGFDFVPNFIQIAKTNHPNKKFELLDIREKLPFKDESFDWGILVSMKGMIIRERGQEEWDTIEKEVKRVCKKTLVLEYGNNNVVEAGKYEVI